MFDLYMQNDVCADFDTRRLFSHLSAKKSKSLKLPAEHTGTENVLSCKVEDISHPTSLMKMLRFCYLLIYFVYLS